MNQWETKIISITSVSFKKNAIGQGDDCAVACLLEYSYYKENLKSDCNRVKQTKSTWCLFRTMQKINLLEIEIRM